MEKRLGFKSFLNVDYAPGMPDQVKKNAKRRKRDGDTTGVVESTSIDEALSPTQRRARARMMKKYKSRVKIGREKAMRRFASPEKLKLRAKKAARKMMFNKLTKGVPKEEIPFQRRQEIEKRLDGMKGRIERIAVKLLPKIRKAEQERHKGKSEND